MSRVSLLSCVFCMASLFALTRNGMAQVGQTATATSAVQIVYVVQSNSILTYDVDPQTLNATQVGTLQVATPNPDYYFWLQSSPNGHFLYYVMNDAQNNLHLYVYRTNTLGAPQGPPTQAMKVNGLWSLQFDPTANFAYTSSRVPLSNGYESAFSIRRYLVDPASGRLSQPEIQAKYVLSTDDSGENCGVVILGFNPAATMLYDEVACDNRDTEGGTYFQRSLNPQTGALGPDVQIYNWAYGSGGFERVQFIGGLMFDMVEPNDFQPGINSVDVYPRVPNTSHPILQCTAAMLESCGYSTGRVHPSGKYLFMQISSSTYQIDKVELSQKKIVDTGNYIVLDWLGQFSPDGTLVYGATNGSGSGYFVEIYGFNIATSTPSTGGGIWIPGSAPFFAAERY